MDGMAGKDGHIWIVRRHHSQNRGTESSLTSIKLLRCHVRFKMVFYFLQLHFVAAALPLFLFDGRYIQFLITIG